jgi:putative ABC transport system permease protein
MDPTLPVIGPVELIWALGMMAIAIALSAWQRLGLEWSLFLATGRTVLQLAVVGYVLAAVFALRSPWVVLAVFCGMTGTAAIVARNRISQKIPQLLPWVGGSILTGALLGLVYTTAFVVRPPTWYEPQYVVPLGGIILGNSMNAAAIAGERLVSTLNASPIEIETHLSLGATPQQAVAQYRKDAVRAGLIPLINTMTVIGLVTLPGIMTGQMLGGADPLVAATYQMVIMFMLALSTIVTTVMVTHGICRQFFNRADQFVRW